MYINVHSTNHSTGSFFQGCIWRSHFHYHFPWFRFDKAFESGFSLRPSAPWSGTAAQAAGCPCWIGLGAKGLSRPLKTLTVLGGGVPKRSSCEEGSELLCKDPFLKSEGIQDALIDLMLLSQGAEAWGMGVRGPAEDDQTCDESSDRMSYYDTVINDRYYIWYIYIHTYIYQWQIIVIVDIRYLPNFEVSQPPTTPQRTLKLFFFCGRFPQQVPNRFWPIGMCCKYYTFIVCGNRLEELQHNPLTYYVRMCGWRRAYLNKTRAALDLQQQQVSLPAQKT